MVKSQNHTKEKQNSKKTKDKKSSSKTLKKKDNVNDPKSNSGKKKVNSKDRNEKKEIKAEEKVIPEESKQDSCESSFLPSKLVPVQTAPGVFSNSVYFALPDTTQTSSGQCSVGANPSQNKGSKEGSFQSSINKINSLQLTPMGMVAENLSLRSFWPKACKKKAHAERLLFVVRSGERIDRVFGKEWINTEIPYGELSPTDQNISQNLRSLIPHTKFFNDPPITEVGRYTSQLIARAMSARHVTPVIIVTSPLIRSIQTACAMAKYMNGKVGIEYGLMEPLSWYRNGNTVEMPDFISIDNLVKEGYPIDIEYIPMVQLSHLQLRSKDENEAEGRQRIDLVLRSLGSSSRNGPLLVVGHAITLHTAYYMTKTTTNLAEDEMPFTSMEDQWDVQLGTEIGTEELGLRYPPGCVLSLARISDPPASYRQIPNLIPPLSYGYEFCNKPVHPVG